MKRTTLKRKTPLKTKTPFAGKRKKLKARSTTKRRQRDVQACRAVSFLPCAMSATPGSQCAGRIDPHHVFKRMGIERDNLVPLCRYHHDLVEHDAKVRHRWQTEFVRVAKLVTVEIEQNYLHRRVNPWMDE